MACITNKLRLAGLRPTRQRVTLGSILFGSGDRHVSAEMLHAEAVASGEQVSLATVYNTLHQFTGGRTSARAGDRRLRGLFRHQHLESQSLFRGKIKHSLLDIPNGSIRVDGLPEPPQGLKISHIDVVVRLVPDDK